MKKILLLSTIIVGTAGMAAADIRLSGGARFGIEYNGDNTSSKTMVHNRITINVDGTAEADNGLSFFARVRIRGNNTGDGLTGTKVGNSKKSNDTQDLRIGSGVSAPRVGVTYEGLTVAAGNILGAIESMPGLYDGTVGLTGLDYSNLPTNAAAIGRFAWDSFSSNGGGANGIEAIYSMGDFSGHISYSGDNVANSWNPTGLTYERGAVYLAYSFGDWTAALAHQQSSQVGEEMTVVTVAGNFGDFGVGMAYSDNEGDNSALRVNGSYTFGSGTTITAFYTGVASGAVVPGTSVAATPAGTGSADDAYGIGFTHSLGGATLAGGYSSRFDGENQADFGVRFNF